VVILTKKVEKNKTNLDEDIAELAYEGLDIKIFNKVIYKNLL